MLNFTKAFGNTGYETQCSGIISARIFVADDSASVEIGHYKDLAAQVAGSDPLSVETVTLKGITAILQGGGKTYLDNIESAIVGLNDFTGAKIATADEIKAVTVLAEPAQQIL